MFTKAVSLSKLGPLVIMTVLLPALPTSKTTDNFNRLQSAVKNREYVMLESSIDWQLSADDAALFRGILANRKNRLQESIQLLAPMAPGLAAAPPAWREQELLKTLGDDYDKVFEYAKAETLFLALSKRYGRRLKSRELRRVGNRLNEMRLLQSAPLQSVKRNSPATVSSTRDQLGLLEIPVEANGKPESWVLDTGANTCVITETTASRIGLRLLEGTATTDDISGLPVIFRVGVSRRTPL
jgi:Aspartyl protease